MAHIHVRDGHLLREFNHDNFILANVLSGVAWLALIDISSSNSDLSPVLVSHFHGARLDDTEMVTRTNSRGIGDVGTVHVYMFM